MSLAPGQYPDRGDIYRVSFRGQEHLLAGPHYAVVVSDRLYNTISTVIVVPFSSRAAEFPFRPSAVIQGTRTLALVDQVGPVNRESLRDYVDSLAGTTVMDEIDEVLRDLFGLDE